MPKAAPSSIIADLMKTPVAIGIIIALAATAALLGVKLKQETEAAAEQKADDTQTIEGLNVDLSRTKNELAEQQASNEQLQVSVINLEKNLTQSSNQFHKASMDLSREREKLAKKSAELEAVSSELKQTKDQLSTTTRRAEKAEQEIVLAKKEIAKRDQQINLLQTERGNLNEQIDELQGNIAKLSQDIQSKQKELDESLGDREFLISELKRLQREKAELEKQLNDLAFLREQVKELKRQLSVKRRLELIRNGIFGAGSQKKGAARLRDKDFAPITRRAPARDFSLEVEVTRDGEVKVAPPKPPSN